MQANPTRPDSRPHYVRLGGHDAVVRLVDAFYGAMDRLPDARTVRAMHDDELSHTKAVLVKYLTEWMGGARLYSPEHGAPMLRRRHHRFDIDAAARDAWMHCMRVALDAVCEDATLRADLDAAFFKVADFMRNTEAPAASHPHQQP